MGVAGGRPDPLVAHQLVVEDARAAAVVRAIADAARSGNESGDGLVWTTPVENVTHNRTGLPLRRAEEEAA